MATMIERARAAVAPALGTPEVPLVTEVNYREGVYLAVRQLIARSTVGIEACSQPEGYTCRQCDIIGHKICDLVKGNEDVHG